MLRFLIILALIIALDTVAVIWMIKQPQAWSGIVLTVVFLLGIAGIAAAAFHLLWRPTFRDFPVQEPAPDAVRRSFQSFGIGIVNMGLSIHVAVDAEYLHLTPLAIWRALGATPVSIPWSAMEPVGRSGRVVRVAGHRLDGPKWCMELASPLETEDEAETSE